MLLQKQMLQMISEQLCILLFRPAGSWVRRRNGALRLVAREEVKRFDQSSLTVLETVRGNIYSPLSFPLLWCWIPSSFLGFM